MESPLELGVAADPEKLLEVLEAGVHEGWVIKDPRGFYEVGHGGAVYDLREALEDLKREQPDIMTAARAAYCADDGTQKLGPGICAELSDSPPQAEDPDPGLNTPADILDDLQNPP